MFSGCKCVNILVTLLVKNGATPDVLAARRRTRNRSFLGHVVTFLFGLFGNKGIVHRLNALFTL